MKLYEITMYTPEQMKRILTGKDIKEEEDQDDEVVDKLKTMFGMK
jgi:hypothetical protein